MCGIFVPGSAYQRFQRRDEQWTEMEAYCCMLCVQGAHPASSRSAFSPRLLSYPVCALRADGKRCEGFARLDMAFRGRRGTVTLSAHAPAFAGKRCAILVVDPGVRPRLGACVGGNGMFVPDLFSLLLAFMHQRGGDQIARILSALPDAEGVLDDAGNFSRTFAVTLPGRLPGILLPPRAAYPPSDTWLMLVLE